MLKNLLDENDKLKINTETVQNFDSLSTKLSLEHKIDIDKTSESDEDNDMSDISIEDVVDCYEFVKTVPEPTKVLISENSVEFARSSKDHNKVLKEEVVVYRKI